MRRRSGIPSAIRISIILMAVLFSALISWSRLGPSLGFILMDQLFFLRGPQSPPAEIVIVAVDEPSFANLGLRWPWPRSLHAELVNALKEAGAKTVAFDVVFAEHSTPTSDQLFARSLAGHGSVVLASDIQTYDDPGYVQEVTVRPLPMFIPAGVATGFVNLPLAADGTIRQADLLRNGLPGFSYLAARSFCRQTDCSEKGWIETLPKRAEMVSINYLGGARSIKTVSYYQALDYQHALPPGIFKDKLVFVGLVTETVANAENKSPDYFPVPMTRLDGGYMAGLEIHAQIAANLLRAANITNVTEWQVLLAGLGLGLGAALVFFRVRPLTGALLLALLYLLLLGITYWLYIKWNLFLPAQFLAIPPGISFVAVFVIHYYRSHKEKKFIQEAFACYVSPRIVQQLMDDPAKLTLEGEQKELTVMFSDIRGFTKISEEMSTEKLAEFMHQYLEAMSEIIMECNGTVDKFIGDAIMAIWGAPVHDPQHAANGVRAALAMSARLDALRAEWLAKGYPPIEIGVGLNTGEMRVGNFGSRQRFDYTVLGDNVNLASRLEGTSKTYGNRIVIAESTRQAIGERFFCRFLDRVRVKGKNVPVAIYEPLAEGEVDPALQAEVARYAEAIACYQRGEFVAALGLMRQLHHENPLALYRLYIERLETIISKPPAPEAWDGVFTFEFK
ncbi:MAG: adenylate/guanylate cyclase domain-containing protein [Desulfobulbaceae bacterium]|nr:adenylate/guanylate cyclase domain-containing protein [Desulfobulbaceae bacterium]